MEEKDSKEKTDEIKQEDLKIEDPSTEEKLVDKSDSKSLITKIDNRVKTKVSFNYGYLIKFTSRMSLTQKGKALKIIN